jgi:N-acyl homoserine lactone hydrolase
MRTGTPDKLYLLQLSATSVPLSQGRALEMASGCYLIGFSSGGHLLVDSGFPPEAKAPVAPVPGSEKSVLDHLSALGLRPADVDMVICTHFDIDHVGYHEVFTSAKFVVQRSHYELARSGHARYAGGRQHWDAPKIGYQLVDGDTELLPGVTLLETSGHAPGHQSVLLRLPRTGPVLLAADAVVMERLFTPDRKAWPTDDNEEELQRSTQKLLDVVRREKVALTVFGHDGLQWRTLRKAPQCYE